MKCRQEYFQTLKTYPWVKSVIYMDKEICKLMTLYELVKGIFMAVTVFLPPEYEVRREVMFLEMSVC